MLNVNCKAPNFELENQYGKIINLNDFKGIKKVIYFYPKDSTPGCTRQACAFRDEIEEYNKLGIKVLGISMDSVKKHTNFIAKNDLPFDLLSDPNHEIIEKYGVWQEKKMYGKVYMGIVRTSFLLDENNNIIKIYDKAKPDTNAKEILEFLKKISN
ncbi:MAG: thioredoxin-dependent thiol peroxidase [Mycoplasmatales bacterium]